MAWSPRSRASPSCPLSPDSLILLPLLVLCAIAGGYLIAGKALKPIHEIADAASQINQGHDTEKAD